MYAHIVVGTDGSDRSMNAVEHAATLARLTNAELHLAQGLAGALAAMPDGAGATGMHPQELRARLEAVHADLRRRLEATGLTVTSHIGEADGASAILAAAETVDADLIVVGNRGMSGLNRLIGSVPNSVSHRATCAVLIVDTDG